MKKRVKAFLLSLVLVFTTLGSMFGTKIEAKADGGVVIKLHYHRADEDYSKWSVWFWEYGKDGADYAFQDENGEMVATIEPSAGTTSVGFIVRTEEWEKDISEDQFIDISEMVSGTVDVYVESGVEGFEKKYGEDAVKGTKLKSAVYSGDSKVSVTMTDTITSDLNEAFSISGKNGEIGIAGVTAGADYVYTLSLSEDLVSTKSYTISYEGQVVKINMPVIYSTEEFENQYTYEGNDLGATWSKESTTFKVWAPTADNMTVRLYPQGDARISDRSDEIEMTLGEKGVWSATVEGDLNGTYYTYAVTIDGVTKEACDPYARTTGVNGERAMVIDLDSTDPEGWDKDTNPHAGETINQAIIYEAHIRDLTTEEDAGIENVGKYLGLAETGTKTASGISTGLDHIKDLGVTHLHILPFYDFGSVDELKVTGSKYNWGYDPVNYNVPEGSYSTDASNGEVRVKEVKEMVQALHNNGISVVMDVVYNHVQNASTFCYNVIVPNYFSRVSDTGVFSNGSGCGNDTASERSMVRKYIVESVCYWADEYHIDGFRFDLVGLLDVDTINEVVEEVHKTHPDVIFYGEGWSLTTTVTKENVELATQTNSSLTPGFAYFNDTIRDGLKGSVFDTGTGFVSGSAGDDPKISRCFLGLDNWCSSPSQTINYASCHDNNTLYDRLVLSRSDASDDEIIEMNKLAAAVYMTSEGVPFMQAGEEMLRSKVNEDGTFNSNSYNAGDSVNSILYSSLEDEKVNNVYEYYKGLIAFRKAHKALQLSTEEEVNEYVTEVKTGISHCLAFSIDGSMEGETADALFVIFNANEEEETVALPDGDWKVCINDEKAGTESLETVNGSVTLKPTSACVLVQGGDKNTGSAAKGIAGIVAGIALVAAGITMLVKRKK